MRIERLRRAWSQQRLAQAVGLGVTQRTISRWETGDVPIGIAGLIAVARAFGQQPGLWLDAALAEPHGPEVTRAELAGWLDAIPDGLRTAGPEPVGGDELMDAMTDYFRRLLADQPASVEEGRMYLAAIHGRAHWWMTHTGRDPYWESRQAWVSFFARLLTQLEATGTLAPNATVGPPG